MAASQSVSRRRGAGRASNQCGVCARTLSVDAEIARGSVRAPSKALRFRLQGLQSAERGGWTTVARARARAIGATGVLSIARLQEASRVEKRRRPRRRRPSEAGPPWPKDVLPTLVSFLLAADAVALNARAKETRRVVRRPVALARLRFGIEEDSRHHSTGALSISIANPYNMWDPRYHLAFPHCRLRNVGILGRPAWSTVHSVRVSFKWSDEGWA